MLDGNDKALRDGLHVLFLHEDPAAAIESWLENRRDPAWRSIPREFEDRLVRAHRERYSRDDGAQIKNILQSGYTKEDGAGVFGLIFDFAGETMVERDREPLVRYEQVLRWRHTVHPLGSLPFISAFLAMEDERNGAKRSNFSLHPVPHTDNRRLQAVLREGMAENHFHLKGSAPSFHLSWISLMNDVEGRREAFRELEKLVLGDSVERLKRPLYVLVMQAAAIRAFLFGRLHERQDEGERTRAEAWLHDWMDAETHQDCARRTRGLQCAIAGLRAVYGTTVYGAFKPDYAVRRLADDGEGRTFDSFSGEYYFQYRMFRAILAGDEAIRPYWDLFYAYLMICVRFRAELVQSNERFGFQNFSRFDRRKGLFLKDGSEFEHAQIVVAAMTNLRDERVRALEARIVPEPTAEGTGRRVRDIDRTLARAGDEAHLPAGDLQPPEKLFYVLHIPKRADMGKTEPRSAQLIHCRDRQMREHTAAVVEGVVRLREGCDSVAGRIRGMDACASEMAARPEVFAPEYRRIKHHQPRFLASRLHEVTMMNLTYHVGEDFLDLVDGLRAIWEAVEFLELGRLDRVGHALALGIEPESWYAPKQYRVFLTRQALLDNCAWMLMMLERNGAAEPALTWELQNVCATQYAAIYQGTLPFTEREMSFDSNNYFCALELRGDEPYAYFSYQSAPTYHKSLELCKAHQPYALRGDEPGSALYECRRYNLQAIRLYHHYHFNPETKRAGNEVVEYEVSKRYVQAVARLQKIMQGALAERGIGIECNPSSNVLIGSFNRYDRHPLVVFNDRGLFNEPDNPNLFVSINTDDQGVFATCLENEYALMARGLEQMTDERGEPRLSGDKIYGWLDHVRKMGLEQSFLNRGGA